MSSPLRLFRIALAASIVIATVGAGWELQRFGLTEHAAARRLEADVRGHVLSRADEVITLARQVAAEHALIADATTSRDALPNLFARLAELSGRATGDGVTATIYVPALPGTYRPLAWSDRASGSIVPQRLNGPASLFVALGAGNAPGAGAMSLVFVQPVEAAGRRIAVVAAETVLSSISQSAASTLTTTRGPVRIIPRSAGAGALASNDGFLISSPDSDTVLVEVLFAPGDLLAKRHEFRRRVIAVAALPFLLALLGCGGFFLSARRRARSVRHWLAWSTGAIAVTLAGTGGLAALVVYTSAPHQLATGCLVLAALATVAILCGGWWWRRPVRRRPADAPVRFVAEQLLVGLLIEAARLACVVLFTRRVTTSSLSSWQSALFPLDVVGLLDIWNVMLGALAICWAIAMTLAVVAERWRLTMLRGWAAVAVTLWLTAPALALAWQPEAARPTGASLPFLAAMFVFALTAGWIRRAYRRTTQSSRLLFGFLALLLPLLTIYPLSAAVVDRATRDVIEHRYAPQTAGQSEDILAVLSRTQQEIDALPTLREPVRSAVVPDSSQTDVPVESQTAFLVWSQTSLSKTRVISDIELYGPDRRLISRFALNFPDYIYRVSTQTWERRHDCNWEVTGEVKRFGSTDRTTVLAQRELCDAAGQFIGAVVLHVAPTDYEALPFISPPNLYADVLGVNGRETSEPAPPNLQLAVYGWSLQPIFTSSQPAWSIDADTFTRLYKEGRPFWTTLEAERRRFHVHLIQNRAGIYALGYPAMTLFEHSARVAEIVAVAGVLFVLWQMATALAAPFTRQIGTPLPTLFHEVRTSFYRKLFLYFVLVAVGPVFLFALAFGGYMTSKFRADVESEAANVVTVARRVFEQVAAAEQPLNQPLSDDVMLWIRQVINQDVNLYEGPDLVATSQRDLFNSGLLPTRTPALVYRRIALDLLPTFVTEERQYLVAASPVRARGHDAVLSVPLAPRQREIADEIDEFYRGVLVGSVLVVLFAAGLGASIAGRMADPVARLTKATRQIAAGRLDVRIAADTADELRRLVDDFNTMTATLVAQRAELARTNQLKAWNEMARQVAHEIKNPLTPIQLAAEHLRRVHDDRGQPLGAVAEQCVRTILEQVRLLRQIASEFANFASEPRPHPETLDVPALVESIVAPYRVGLSDKIAFTVDAASAVPPIHADRTLLVRALTNLVENAIQAMPQGGALAIRIAVEQGRVTIRIADTGVGMDETAVARAFEPYFSTKVGGSGLGLANAKRTIEREGGTIDLTSVPGEGTTITIALAPAPAPPDARGDDSGRSR